MITVTSAAVNGAAERNALRVRKELPRTVPNITQPCRKETECRGLRKYRT
jgi:hypothetical protein